MIQPSHDANRKTDVIIEIVVVVGIWISSISNNTVPGRSILTPIADWNSGVNKIPPRTPASHPKVPIAIPPPMRALVYKLFPCSGPISKFGSTALLPVDEQECNICTGSQGPLQDHIRSICPYCFFEAIESSILFCDTPKRFYDTFRVDAFRIPGLICICRLSVLRRWDSFGGILGCPSHLAYMLWNIVSWLGKSNRMVAFGGERYLPEILQYRWVTGSKQPWKAQKHVENA